MIFYPWQLLCGSVALSHISCFAPVRFLQMLASFMVLLLEEGPDPQPWEETLHGMIRGSGFEQNMCSNKNLGIGWHV